MTHQFWLIARDGVVETTPAQDQTASGVTMANFRDSIAKTGVQMGVQNFFESQKILHLYGFTSFFQLTPAHQSRLGVKSIDGFGTFFHCAITNYEVYFSDC